MNKYTVVYLPGAEKQLATLYMDAPDPTDVTDAADRIDAILKRDPYTFSESRYGNARVMFVTRSPWRLT